MRVLLCLLALIGTTASAEQQDLSVPFKTTLREAADGYRFLVKDYENLAPGVEFVLLRDPDMQKETLSEVFGIKWKKIAGFTYWNEEKGTCRIIIKDPAWRYEPEIIGHEVAHCIWGKFHKGAEGKGGWRE